MGPKTNTLGKSTENCVLRWDLVHICQPDQILISPETLNLTALKLRQSHESSIGQHEMRICLQTKEKNSKDLNKTDKHAAKANEMRSNVAHMTTTHKK